MIAAVIVLGVVCLVLFLVLAKDESSYHSGYADGYRQGARDVRDYRLRRAQARAGLESIGIDPSDPAYDLVREQRGHDDAA